jgi:hypothetical protein
MVAKTYTITEGDLLWLEEIVGNAMTETYFTFQNKTPEEEKAFQDMIMDVLGKINSLKNES